MTPTPKSMLRHGVQYLDEEASQNRRSFSRVTSPGTHHYFVDEAGDLAFFDKRGQVAIGGEGVSQTFVVGALFHKDPDGLAVRIEGLRRRLLEDSFLRTAPSMLSASRKTARAFHAKNDLPEVRLEVFRLLAQEDMQMFVAFRRKHRVARDLATYYARKGRKGEVEAIYEQLLLPISRTASISPMQIASCLRVAGSLGAPTRSGPRLTSPRRVLSRSGREESTARRRCPRRIPTSLLDCRLRTICFGPCSASWSVGISVSSNRCASDMRSLWTSMTREVTVTANTTRRGIRSLWNA